MANIPGQNPLVSVFRFGFVPVAPPNIAASGSYIETGIAAKFNIALTATTASYLETGNDAGPTVAPVGYLGQIPGQNPLVTILRFGFEPRTAPATGPGFLRRDQQYALLGLAKPFITFGRKIYFTSSADQSGPSSAGSFSLNGRAAVFNVGLISGTASYAFNGVPAGGVSLIANVGAFTLTGNAALFNIGEPAAAGGFAQTGIAVAFNIRLVAAAGGYSFSGIPAGGFSLQAGTGNYVLTGNAAGFTLSLNTGTYTEAGQAANFASTLTAAPASYLVTGNAAFGPIKLTAAPGAYLLTGNAAAYTESFVSSAASFSITGQAAAFKATITAAATNYIIVVNGIGGPTLIAAAGTFIETGQTALLRPAIVAGKANYVVSGFPAADVRLPRVTKSQRPIAGQAQRPSSAGGRRPT